MALDLTEEENLTIVALLIEIPIATATRIIADALPPQAAARLAATAPMTIGLPTGGCIPIRPGNRRRYGRTRNI
jgi:hypothetical protein